MAQNNPAPPPGFVPVDTGTPPPPPAGFVPTDQAQTTTNPPPKQANDDQWGSQWASDASDAVKNAVVGAGKGLLSTVSGTDDWARKHLPAVLTENPLTGKPADLQRVHEAATPQGAAQSTGYGLESLAEFIMGDEALKALPVSQRLLKASKIMQSVEESPLLSRVFNAGVRAVRGAAVGSVQAGAKTGDPVTAAKTGATTGVLAGVVPELPSVLKAARKPFSLDAVQDALENSKGTIQQSLQSDLQGIQDAWHGSVRDLFDQVAKEAGVQPKPSESLRDVAANTAAAVKAKASAMYKQLDQAVGGTRFQTFDEQIGNVKRALRNSAGIDPDSDGRLIERINQLEDAKAAALDQAKAAGVDPKLIDSANAAWRQASALEDLSKHVQASTSGLRGDLAQGVKAAPESLSPARLAPRANRLYNTGRLQQAIGDSRADELLKSIETTKQSAQDAAENAVKQTEAATANAVQRTAAVRRNQTIGAAAAGSVGAGGGLAWLKHLLGE